MSQAATRKKYGLLFLALAVGAVAIAAAMLGSRNYAIRLVGLLAIVVSVRLFRLSNFRSAPAPLAPIESEATIRSEERFEHPMSAIGIVLVPLMAFSSYWLYEDARHGYHEAWPLYVFVGLGLICAGVWPYLLARHLR